MSERMQKALDKKEQETLLFSIRNVMESFGVSVEKAMDVLKIPGSQRTDYVNLINAK